MIVERFVLFHAARHVAVVLRRTLCYPQSRWKVARTSVSRCAQQVDYGRYRCGRRKSFIYHVYICNDAHTTEEEEEDSIGTSHFDEGEWRHACSGEHRLLHCGCRLLRGSHLLLLSLLPALFLRLSLRVCTASSSGDGSR